MSRTMPTFLLHTISTIILMFLLRCTIPASASVESKNQNNRSLRGIVDHQEEQTIIQFIDTCPETLPKSGSQCSAEATTICRYNFKEVPTFMGDGLCSAPTTCQPTEICGCHGGTWMCFPIVEGGCNSENNDEGLPDNAFQECIPEEGKQHVFHQVSTSSTR